MIITLVGADFSVNKIGTLTTWNVSYIECEGVTYSGDTSVTRGGALSATATIAEGYEIGSAGVTVTMGGQAQSGVVTTSTDGKTITISIGSVTGNVVIKVPTVDESGNESTGGNEGSGSGNETTNYPTATTWYVNAASTALTTECNTSNNSYGWAYADTTEQAAIRDKYINAIQFVTTSTSGTVTIGIADAVNATSVHSVQTTTFTKSGTSKEIVTAVFATPFKLTESQILVFEPSTASQRNYNHYFGSQGSGAKSFLSRIPTDLANTNKQWSTNSGNSIGISVGYYVDEDTETPDSGSTDSNGITWYTTGNASTSNSSSCKSGNGSNGWSYGTSTSGSTDIQNVPINYVRFCTDSTSGDVKVGIAASKGATEIKSVVTGSFTKSNTSKEIVTVKLSDTITLATGEFLVIHPYLSEGDTHNYNFYFASSGGVGYYSRIPTDLGATSTAAPWKAFANYNIGWDFGYKAD